MKYNVKAVKLGIGHDDGSSMECNLYITVRRRLLKYGMIPGEENFNIFGLTKKKKKALINL